MYYSYVEIEYVATSFSPARTDLALKLLREVSGIKPVCVCCGLLDNSLRGSSPRPFIYRMDLNGNKTLYGKSLGSNQATFVIEFSTIVLGVQVPGQSYTE